MAQEELDGAATSSLPLKAPMKQKQKPKIKPTKPCKAWFVVDADGNALVYSGMSQRNQCVSEFSTNVRGDWCYLRAAGYRVERLTIGANNAN